MSVQVRIRKYDPLIFSKAPVVKQWQADDVCITYLDLAFKEHTSLEWESDEELVMMYFMLKGKALIRHTAFEKQLETGAYQHNLIYPAKGTGSIKNEELHLTALLITFTKQAFAEFTKHGSGLLKDCARKVKEGNTFMLSAQSLFIDIAMQSVLTSIIDYTYGEELRSIFLRAKVLELLVMQAEAHARSQLPQNKYIKNDYDKERILFARDYLIQRMDMPPSLPGLALITGINEFKLKRGFKEVFNTTVFGYLSDARLELAKNELTAKQKSASEIAFELGYSSIQHFSKAFKKKFGVSPTELK